MKQGRHISRAILFTRLKPMGPTGTRAHQAGISGCQPNVSLQIWPLGIPIQPANPLTSKRQEQSWPFKGKGFQSSPTWGKHHL